MSASFALRLPREDNERDGLGNIQVWNIGLKASEGENIYLDIETANSLEVNERETAVCKVTLCNKTSDHEAVWTYDKEILLRDNAIYTVMFDAKQDGKLKKGMQIELTFFDKEGNKLGTREENFNRKSWLYVKKYNMYTQCDAICYWYTNCLLYTYDAADEL